MATDSSAKRKNSTFSLSRERLVRLLARYGIFLVLFVLIAAISIMTPIIRDGNQFFLTTRNFIQIMLQASINATIAVGTTFVITSGGIDLSVGSIVALAGVVAALVMRDVPFEDFNAALGLGTFPTKAIAGLLVCILVGGLCGAFNGFLVTVVKLPPFIATLGTLGIFRGLALIISDGRPIFGFGREFLQAFSGDFAGTSIPVAVVVAFAVALIGWFIYRFTKFGKYTVAIGGNEQTTRLAGIPVERYKMGVYIFAGLLTGVAAALLLARLSSGDPTFGTLFELDAIAASVMGGTSLTGGEGSIPGTMVGALIISIVRNAINIFNLPSYYQQIVIGSVIVLAVMLDQWRKRQTERF